VVVQTQEGRWHARYPVCDPFGIVRIVARRVSGGLRGARPPANFCDPFGIKNSCDASGINSRFILEARIESPGPDRGSEMQLFLP
jgi:hypothetical protein